MKIRHGFVSNSSSSSFLVKLNDERFPKLTDEQKAALEDFGFKRGNGIIPGSFRENSETFIEADSYGYEILCNQDEVIAFLIENQISFMAEMHYGDEGAIYYSDRDELIIAQNPVRHLFMGYEGKIPIQVGMEFTTGKKFLEDYKKNFK